MTPPNAKKGIGNKEEGIGHQEAIEGKALIEMDLKALLKHQKTIRPQEWLPEIKVDE
jgi:hypothetical protein